MLRHLPSKSQQPTQPRLTVKTTALKRQHAKLSIKLPTKLPIKSRNRPKSPPNRSNLSRFPTRSFWSTTHPHSNSIQLHSPVSRFQPLPQFTMATKRITDFFPLTSKKTKTTSETTEDETKLVQLSSDSPISDNKENTTDNKENTTDNKENTKPTTTPTPTPAPAPTVTQRKAFTFETLENGLPDDWRKALSAEFTKPYWISLKKQLIVERDSGKQIFPTTQNIFTAFWHCPLDSIRVVLIGQDPYHDDNQAMGLSFSIPPTMKRLPPSLNNIYKELETDMSIPKPTKGDLSNWARQGVFLLNTVLTVRAHEANSHSKFGWLAFTDAVVKILSAKSNLVWILWGKPAETKAKGVNSKNNCLIISVHPSPLSASRGFFGSKPFSKCNDYLVKQNLKPIDWKP